jgi:hypothetical protein
MDIARARVWRDSDLRYPFRCHRYLSDLPDTGGGRGVNIPGYMAFAADLLNITQASATGWLVQVTDAQRPSFEANALDTAQRLDPSGALAAQVAAQGIHEAPPGTVGVPSAFVRAPPAPQYVAVWATQRRPPPSPLLPDPNFLLNSFADAPRRPALQRVIDTNAVAMTDLMTYMYVDAPGANIPSSVVFAPAWTELQSNSTYGVGIAAPAPLANASAGRSISAIGFRWETVLGDTLPSFMDALVAVLRSPSGAMWTFTVSGRAVASAGAGDLHASLGSLVSHGQRLNFTAVDDDAPWCIMLYPTAKVRAGLRLRACVRCVQQPVDAPAHCWLQLRDQYVTDKPLGNAAGIAIAILACALLFGWYEFIDRRRSQHINTRLIAYVRQLEQMKHELQEGCAREAQAQARVLAEETSSRQKDQFVAMVSHEIRTPLNAVGGASALLADTPLNSEQRELVALLEAGTAHVVLIIEARAAARRQRRGMRALSATDACTGRHRTS